MPSVRALGAAALIMGMWAGAPSFAGAQSATAWILWEKYFTMKGDTGSTAWEPQDGFESLAECRTAAKQLLQNALAYVKSNAGKPLGPVQLDGRAIVFEVTESGVRQRIDARYLCFPGAFDPRPRP